MEGTRPGGRGGRAAKAPAVVRQGPEENRHSPRASRQPTDKVTARAADLSRRARWCARDVLRRGTRMGANRHAVQENVSTGSIQLTLGGYFFRWAIATEQIFSHFDPWINPPPAVACASPLPATAPAAFDRPFLQWMRLYRHGRQCCYEKRAESCIADHLYVTRRPKR